MGCLPKVEVSGPVLRWARESIGIPLEKAAERIGIPPGELSTRESEGVVLRFTELERLATLYHRPTAAFLFGVPPTESPLPPDHRTIRSQGQYPLSTETIMAIRFAQRVQELASDIAELVGETLLAKLPAASLTDDPDAVARFTRDSLGVGLSMQSAWRGYYGALAGWTAALESVGVYVLRQKMPLLETRGFALLGRPPVIVLNSEDAANGRTFSLMHELCHLMLSLSSICDMRLTGYDSASRGIEVFCNRFAGSLLVPEEALLAAVAGRPSDPTWNENELRPLARQFRVSQEVVLRRLLIVGETDDDFYGEWRDQAEASYATWRATRNRGRGQPPAQRAAQENGRLFTGQVMRAESGRVLSATEAAQYLGLGVKHLDTVRELSR